jgi:hypothetical protein
MKGLSIILPYYKRFDAFAQALSANHANLTSTPGRPTEVVLVLDEPTEEGAVLRAVRGRPSVSWRVLINRRDHRWRNPAVAINVGLRHARGEFVLIMSPETLHVTNVPQVLYEWAYGAQSHLVLGRICWCPRRDVDEKGLARAFEETEPKRYYGSACGLRAAFEAVGGYDESNRSWGCDDDNIRSRLRLAGLRLKHLPAAKAIHPLEPGEVNHNRIRRREKTWLERHSYERPSIAAANGADWGREFDEVIYDREASAPPGVAATRVPEPG